MLEARDRRHSCLTSAQAPSFGRTLAAPLVVVLGLLFAACGTNGLNFLQDNRVAITAPSDRAQVDFPITVTWTVKDFKITGADGQRRPDAGYFGVFVDRSPQPPQEKQEWLVRENQRCRRIPGCPDEEFLALQDIHSTTERKFTIGSLPEPSSNSTQRRREFHDVTIILLNGMGERIGESAFTVQFEVNRAQ